MATWRPSLSLVRAPAAAGRASGLSGLWSVQRGGLPAEGGELARARDRDGAGRLAAVLAQMRPTLVQAALRAPGDLNDARVLSGLAGGELAADARTAPVVVGGLDQQPARVRRAGLGDRALHALAVGRVFGWHDPEEAGQQRRPGEPLEAADVGAHAGGRQRVDP